MLCVWDFNVVIIGPNLKTTSLNSLKIIKSLRLPNIVFIRLMFKRHWTMSSNINNYFTLKSEHNYLSLLNTVVNLTK